MAFIESRFLDDFIALGSSSGPRYQTEIIELSSGEEQRNQAWDFPRHRYLIGISLKTSDEIDTLKQLQHTTRGRLNGFRFKDFNDFTSAATLKSTPAFDDQEISAGDGATLTYQVIKNYAAGSGSQTRKITKIVSGTFVTGFTGSGWTQQDTGNRIAINTNTGIITYSADVQKTITLAADIGGGVTRLTAASHGLTSASGTIHLSTFTGDWAGMNDRRVPIVASTSSTLDVTFNSSSYALYSGNGGQLNTIPQAAEDIVWGGEFDVPVRFASDETQIEKVSPGLERSTIELIEIK